MKEYKVIVDSNGDIFWYKLGTDILHREDGPAAEFNNDDKCWYKNGLRHREDGPAVEYKTGDFEYWLDGKRHREDGPAVKYKGTIEYWLKGKKYSSKEEYEKELAGCNNKIVEIDGKKYKLTEIE